ncbi:transcriptional regulator [Bacillus sp. FJAT-27264]|uniref:helix-turn-helix domain-containing protein n=1 Tax=Paenibacillus sp. (strain DSM 101736 / FJAT-27264) TaxID=1850362 RepID=UPI000807AEA5|nr:helix-turn-helix transcriptional regulator [Bacillus sp. FJAT-27264]OBZ08898.1 transcriptional regulator [Bacillus sp. FJAT-27264]
MYEKFLVLLKKSGKTPYQVAKDTGVSTATLTNWKQGNYKPKTDKLKIIADYFGVTVDFFLQVDETVVGK